MEACINLLEEPALIFITCIIKNGAKVYLVYLVNSMYQKDGADYSCCTDSKAYSNCNAMQKYTVP